MRTLLRSFKRRTVSVLKDLKLLENGVKFFFDELRNRKLLWNLSTFEPETHPGYVTSISESLPYLQVSKLAVEDDEVFCKFKSNAEYRAVLEHCSYDQGLEYLELLRVDSIEYRILKLLASEDIGQPLTYRYPGFDKVSPTQIRYAKVAQDIHLLFGQLNDMSVAEIGAGYGGQAAHLLLADEIQSYSILDLEFPGRLAMKYLQSHGVTFSEVFNRSSLVEPLSPDLVISNYAFSELTREVQEVYLENVILKSSRGYFIYNHIHEDPNTGISALEFAARVPGAKIFREVPLTFPGNVLIVWGHHEGVLPVDLFFEI